MLPAQVGFVLFVLVLSCLMSFLVSGITTFSNAGLIDEFFGLWVNAWLRSWIVAFPVALVSIPVARRVVGALVKS